MSPELSSPKPLSTETVIELTAELALIYVAMGWANQEIETYAAASRLSDLAMSRISGSSLAEIDPNDFRLAQIEASRDRCEHLSALTGIFLATAFPDRFQAMHLLMTFVTKDTPEGRAEAKRWQYDTWLLLLGADGVHYAVSPPLHEAPEGDRIVKVLKAETLEGILSAVQVERAHWEFPSTEAVHAHRQNDATIPDNFFKPIANGCAVNTLALVPDAQRGHPMAAPYLMRQTDLYADDPDAAATAR